MFVSHWYRKQQGCPYHWTSWCCVMKTLSRPLIVFSISPKSRSQFSEIQIYWCEIFCVKIKRLEMLWKLLVKLASCFTLPRHLHIHIDSFAAACGRWDRCISAISADKQKRTASCIPASFFSAQTFLPEYPMFATFRWTCQWAQIAMGRLSDCCEANHFWSLC